MKLKTAKLRTMPHKLVAFTLLMTFGLVSVAKAAEAPPAGTAVENSLQGKTMIFVSYGGTTQEGQVKSLEGFVKKTGVGLLEDGPTEEAKIQAQVESGNVSWDVVDTGDYTPYLYCGKFLQKLDFTKIDISKVPEGQVTECSVPAFNYGVMIFYKKSVYGDNPPKGWKDFFDMEKFPGTRAVGGFVEPPAYLMEQALLADGVEKDKLFPMDYDHAFKKMEALRTSLIFWETGAQSTQMMESGEADMVVAWSGRGMLAIKNGADYAPVWKDWVVVMDHFTIPVGVKDSDASHAMINYLIGKEAQEIMAETTSYTPINNDAKPKIDEFAKAYLTNTPERQAQAYHLNTAYWAANYQELLDHWAAFVTGN